MSKWLSQEWLDETRKMAEGQPERPGASARMQYVVTGAPDGDIDYYWVLESGKITESQLGRLDDAEVTLTTAYPEDLFSRSRRVSSTPTPRFMQGKVKVTGNMAKVMSAAAHAPTRPSTSSRSRDRGDHRVLISGWLSNFGIC